MTAHRTREAIRDAVSPDRSPSSLKSRLETGSSPLASELSRAQSVPDDSTPSLRRRLMATAGRIVGATERDDFLKRVSRATGYRLSPGAAGAIRDAIAFAPDGIERNVDLVRLPDEGVWIEFADADRRAASVAVEGRRMPETVGILCTPDESDGDRFVVMAAWDFEPRFGDRPDALVRHGYGAAKLSHDVLAEHAFLARKGRVERDRSPVERIVGLTVAYVPPGLRDEAVETLGLDGGKGDEDAETLLGSILQDIVDEVPLALAACLLLSASGVRVGPEDAEGLSTVEVSPGRLDRLAARLLGHGFRRGGPAPRPTLSFVPLR